MAGIVVGAVSAPVLETGGIDHNFEEVGGDRARMENASLVTTVKTTKNVWSIVTSLLNDADATALESAIKTAAPIACSGDALGAAYNCAGQLLKRERVPIGGVMWYRVHFNLIEV